MRKIFLFSFFSAFLCGTVYSQIDDVLKHIPGVGDIFEPAVTTSIKDAYPRALWMKSLENRLRLKGGVNFSPELDAGYYRYRFNTFCLQAGTYAPTEGSGYLVAPLKGSKAKLIKDIIMRYTEHPEIDQKDVQMLIWCIETKMKFSMLPPDFQLKVKPLLKPEEIALMEIDFTQIAWDLLPIEAIEVLNFYNDIRNKLSMASTVYEEIEKLAVKTGIAPLGKGSKNYDAGTWTSIGDGVFMRCFPQTYLKSVIEIFIPEQVSINKDNSGNIISFDNNTYKIDLNYEAGFDNYKTAVIKNILTSEEITIENIGDIVSSKKDSDDFVSLVKKSLGKKKSKRLTKELTKLITQLKSVEQTLNEISDKSSLVTNGNTLCVNAIVSLISEIETGNKKGGSRRHKNGLGNISGLVHSPANTSMQRLGTGGPEGPSQGDPNQGDPNQGDPNPKEKEKKDCKVKVSINPVIESEIPQPDWVYTVTVDINIESSDEQCNAEEIAFTLFDVSKERGRYMNDNEKYDDVEEDLQISDLNSDYTITKTTAAKRLGGKSQTQQIAIVCRDYGAFGKLQASVKVKGTWYQATSGINTFVTIPVDVNNNKIADAWEKQNNVYGKPDTWDGDPKPSGQGDIGDGMTNYEEYRGFFILDGVGNPQYKRTNPLVREIFVVDEGLIFSPNSWKSATGMDSYWVSKDQTNAPRVRDVENNEHRLLNFCRGHAEGKKYAINLIKAPGMDDPFGRNPGKYIFGYNVGSPPRIASLTVIFPERIKNWIIEEADTLARYLKKFPKGYELEGTIYSASVIKNFIMAVKDNTKRGYIVDFLVYSIVLHEMGHACDVDHHGGDDSLKTGTGALSCPTIYTDGSGEAKRTVRLVYFLNKFKKNENLIVDFESLKFCKKKDNCWRQLKINDRF
jgi:hypothetical protein